jgi:hypothetical protein
LQDRCGVNYTIICFFLCLVFKDVNKNPGYNTRPPITDKDTHVFILLYLHAKIGKDILFSDLLITRAGMLSAKCVTGQLVYVYGHSVRAKNGQVQLRIKTERFLSWGTFCTLMHTLHMLIRCCLLVQIFCKLSYGWSSVSCSYSYAVLHTEFAVMGFFLLKYALHLGISHYAA